MHWTLVYKITQICDFQTNPVVQPCCCVDFAGAARWFSHVFFYLPKVGQWQLDVFAQTTRLTCAGLLNPGWRCFLSLIGKKCVSCHKCTMYIYRYCALARVWGCLRANRPTTTHGPHFAERANTKHAILDSLVLAHWAERTKLNGSVADGKSRSRRQQVPFWFKWITQGNVGSWRSKLKLLIQDGFSSPNL